MLLHIKIYRIRLISPQITSQIWAWHFIKTLENHLQCASFASCLSTSQVLPWALARHVTFRFGHASPMPGTFSLPPRVSDPDMHQGTCVKHMPCCMPGSLTNGFFLSRWRGKHSRHSQRMHNLQFYVSGPRFTNVFSIAIQIRCKFRFTLTSILIQWSLLNCCTRHDKSFLQSDGQQRNSSKAKSQSNLNCEQKFVSEI